MFASDPFAAYVPVVLPRFQRPRPEYDLRQRSAERFPLDPGSVAQRMRGGEADRDER